VFVFYGLLFFLMSETRALLFVRFGFRRVALACVGITLAAMMTFASPLCRQDRSSLVFVDVGQGDCLHIRTPDGKNYLVDGGGSVDYNIGEKTLLPYLLKNGVGRLDGIFATHLHTDHWRGLCELSEHMDVGNVYIYEGNVVREKEIVRDAAIGDGEMRGTGNAESDEGGGARGYAGDEDRFTYGNDKSAVRVNRGMLEYVAQGDTITLGDAVRLEVLYPPRRTNEAYVSAAEAEDDGRGDENANSLIMKIDYGGVTALMTGDAGEAAERELIDVYAGDGETSASKLQSGEGLTLRSRILKVGHHGSKYSTSDDFLTAVAPDAAVIQVGRNNFGHPTAEVLDKLRRDDIMILRNDLGGAVMFAIRDGKVIYAGHCATRVQGN
jgi:competence protein ComEC